ncbi:TPA: nitrogen fixation protein NifR [Staphylococcus aureus]|nr:nitrogen fixation protein NifR [Staphylococcus aureus]PTY66661.1 nitrogen fixation protein NifR [Staphylococcus aureus]PZH30780.1 nitrogen fixation protein NifR [Staphylococcus aureus]QJP41571.1 nitrogen fixation protein NifR [Staphylococcus aureus]HAR7131813.1 nitrogen fixation protein NifR [Staphylococcus aureus]
MAGPQHSEIGFLISTDIASWGGHNKMKLDPQFLQTLQIGETGHKLRSWRKVSFYEYNKKAR